MKNKKTIMICAVSIVLLLLAVWGIWYYFTTRNFVDPHIGMFDVDYTVQPYNIEGKIIKVTVKLSPQKLSKERTFYLDNGAVKTSNPTCVDNKGNMVATEYLDGVWMIGPVELDTESVSFSYNVTLADKDLSRSTVSGDMYQDLLAFQGNVVLMFPWMDDQNLKQTEKYISSLSFQYDGEQNWQGILPFDQPLSDTLSFHLKNPTWYDLYDLSNSSFCFGTFQQLEYTTVDGNAANIYLDSALAGAMNADDALMLKSFIEYYNSIFGGNPKNCPIVLLRTSQDENSTILGGAGGRGAAISLEMRSPDDCQTLSRTLYHAFFDSNIHMRNLRYAPHLWLYEGLGNYYIDQSAEDLPANLKSAYGIQLQDSLRNKYLKYLYFSLKDPEFLAATADMEGQMSIERNAFYFDIKTPMLILTIETLAAQEGKGPHAIMQYLMAQEKNSDINVENMMKSILGNNEKLMLQYFSGAAYIPNYWNFSGDSMAQQEILDILNTEENKYNNMYMQRNLFYPYDPAAILPAELMEREIRDRNLHYNQPAVEELVRGFSTTLHQLLMQHALRANLCGIEDAGATGVRYELCTDENLTVWTTYLEQNGFNAQE